MKVLLVEDEQGLREGLAAYLKLKGVTVQTAESLAQGLAALDQEDFDVVVTDWRLKDGVARPIVLACPDHTIVVSGHPAEVEDLVRCRTLQKPVPPKVLLANVLELQATLMAAVEAKNAETADACRSNQGADSDCASSHAGPTASTPASISSHSWPDPELPPDTRTYLRLAVKMLDEPFDVAVLDDGAFVTLEATLRTEHTSSAQKLARLGGDLRIASAGDRSTVLWRLRRDGRPEGIDTVIGPEDPWPDSDLCVDFTGPCTVERFSILLPQAHFAIALGRRVQFLHVPAHLRLWAETSGMAGDMPKRDPVGPRLPPELADLWR